jgi:hypothetical protein
MYKTGILHANINEPYAKLGSSIMGDKCSLVGIYFDNSFALYRVFDGSYLDYFSPGTTIEILSNHWLVSDLTVIELDEEAWMLDGHDKELGDTLKDRLRSAFNKSLLSPTKKDYKSILMYYANLDNRPITNGYWRVNEISLAACGEDPNRVRETMPQAIINTKYHNPPVTISHPFKYAYTDPSPDVIRRDTTSYIEGLSCAFTHLILDNKLYQRYIISIGFKSEMTIGVELPKIETSGTVPYKDTCDRRNNEKIEESMGTIRNNIQTMVDGLSTDKLPVILLGDLIQGYNDLAGELDIIKIQKSVDGILGSSSALIVSGTDGLYEGEVNVELKCGDAAFISIRNPCLDNFTFQELIEILRYTMSINNYDNRYSHLMNKLTEELSMRAKQKKTI